MSCMQVSRGRPHMLTSYQRGRGKDPVVVLGKIKLAVAVNMGSSKAAGRDPKHCKSGSSQLMAQSHTINWTNSPVRVSLFLLAFAEFNTGGHGCDKSEQPDELCKKRV